ncbi:MAG: MerR family transcriptional regulator [Candidatus Gastranaerophilales bacterium]|nr:MerR family transcriptional regulator [Candidatus Gastranaerophilales bacterium]
MTTTEQSTLYSLDSSTGLLPIGAIARTLGVHPRTLRIYDQQNILIPQRSEGDRRIYSFDDVEKAKLIQFLTRNLALNLSGVKIILAMLEEMKLKPKEYLQYVQKIAEIANIDTDIQQINIKKTSKRGRKAKSKKEN